MLNGERYQRQHALRLVRAVNDGEKDQVTPNEHIRRIIQSAIQVGIPFVKNDDPFVVLGNDGLDMSWFPTGSFKTHEEALLHVRQKQEEEHIYSDGDDASTTFHIFTREGVNVLQTER